MAGVETSIRILEEVAMQRHRGYAGPVDPSSRTVLDTAIGVLVGVRGCAPEEAFAELARVVHGSGIGIGRISQALLDLARGTSGSSAEHAEAFNAWGPVIAGARDRTVGVVS
jgi:hypothetical protein